MSESGKTKAAPPPAAPPAGQADLLGVRSRYLRVEELRWLRNLIFASRKVVQGQYAGRHSSPMRGHSVEFSDYRQYMPGDEPTDIDWRVFGRSDRLFVKLYEQQSDMTVNLVLDGSASMAYAGVDDQAEQSVSKFDHACRMAAAIAFLIIKQQDRLSLSIAREGTGASCRQSGSFRHLHDVLRTLEDFRPTGQARMPDALRQLAQRVSRRGLVILFSDLLDDLEETFDALSIFTHHGSEVVVFQVLHADELALPAVQDATFVDSENGRRVRLNVRDIRRTYDQRLRRFLTQCTSICRGRGIDYNLVSTARPHMEALGEYLLRRSSMV